MNIKYKLTFCQINVYLPVLLELDDGPAAGDGEGVMEELAGEGTVRDSGVWLKSSRHIGEFALYISTCNQPRNLKQKKNNRLLKITGKKHLFNRLADIADR